jgi:hypothetical protein
MFNSIVVGMKRRIRAIAGIELLLLALAVFGGICRFSSPTATAFSDGGNINVATEYSNGSIGDPTGELALWYAWINTNGTQIIYLAYQSYKYPPPVTTFLGQHYHTGNNTEVFVGNTLTAMEVYNDTNKNGVPDVDFANRSSELLYNFAVNSSQSFEITPIKKSMIDGVPHYAWGIRYNTIDGFLLSENQSTSVTVALDYMAFSYDFYIQGNLSYLKTNFGIGKILHATPFRNGNVTLNGLSLSLLYGTTVITPKSYAMLVSGEPYNSTTAQNSTKPAESSEIRIEDTKAYEFMFGQNYTLFRDSQNETCQSKSAAVADRSVPGGVYRSVESLLSDFESVLSGLFPKISNMQPAINLDYNVSSFLYRVCYPKWDGYKLEHDPTYVAHLNSMTVPEIGPPLMFVFIAVALGTVSLIAAMYDLRKTRKMTGSPMQSSPAAIP